MSSKVFKAVFSIIATYVSYCRLSKSEESKIMKDSIAIKRIIVKLYRNTRIAAS